ncbi:MAG: hypothetical protein Kow00114_04750 [Kiloniellaceae bacterium]
MGEIVDLDAYRAAQRRRRSEEAKRKERSRALVERSETSNAKPETGLLPEAEPVKDDPA